MIVILGCIFISFIIGVLIGERELRNKFDIVPGEKYLTPDCIEGRLSIVELDKKYFITKVWVKEK